MWPQAVILILFPVTLPLPITIVRCMEAGLATLSQSCMHDCRIENPQWTGHENKKTKTLIDDSNQVASCISTEAVENESKSDSCNLS